MYTFLLSIKKFQSSYKIKINKKFPNIINSNNLTIKRYILKKKLGFK